MSDGPHELFKAFVPPPKRETIASNDIEALAIKTIVVSLVALIAKEQELRGCLPAQAWINTLAEVVAEAVAGSEYKRSDGKPSEGIKKQVIENAMAILAGIKFPKVEGGS